MRRLDRIAIASRAFCLAAILGLSLASGSLRSVEATLALTLVAGLVSVWSRTDDGAVRPALLAAEALAVGALIALALPSGLPLLPYLVVPALIAGVSRGVRTLALVLIGELAPLIAFPLLWANLEPREWVDFIAPWLLTSLGVGLLGSWLKQLGKVPEASPAEGAYESARRLLTQLRTVARRLSAGLDPVSMAAQLLSYLHEHLHDTRSAVFIRTDGGVLSPLQYRGHGPVGPIESDPIIDECWAEMEPRHGIRHPVASNLRYRTAIPLRVGSRMIGVVVADREGPVGDIPHEVMQVVDEHSLRLDTALAFEEVRSLATVEERHRLAREIHDGIAQEIASLGYAVDDLAATVSDPAHSGRLRELRGDLSRLVSELRLSIFDLRTHVTPSAGLGSVLSDYVHQVGARSSMTVHLTLDEAPTRLHAAVETELFRIAQEAITNARKHANANNLWVDCQVRPPFAHIEIRDDGNGLGPSRSDSYGFRIMQERAKRIDADLAIGSLDTECDTNGTKVTITLGDD